MSAGFAELGLTERELHKHTVLEVLPFDFRRYEQEGRIDTKRSTLLVVYYAPGADKAEAFTAPLPAAFSQVSEPMEG
jgi:hypothetical protein